MAGKESALGRWHDAETGLFGPEAWSRILAAESARLRRHGGVATVVVVELAPPATTARAARAPASTVGDVAGLLTSTARTSDLVARLGPDRFAILLPETDEVAAVNFVERVRPSCDRAVAADPMGRCRFGWADTKGSRSLEDAVSVAEARVGTDR